MGGFDEVVTQQPVSTLHRTPGPPRQPPLSERAVVFFDLETGGLEPERHPIIQLAAVAVSGDLERELGELEIKLRFDPAHCEVEALRGNSFGLNQPWPSSERPNEMLSTDGMAWESRFDECMLAARANWDCTAVPEAEALRRFSAFLRGRATTRMLSKRGNVYNLARLGGHNVARFDVEFTTKWFKRHEAFFPAHHRVLDTYQLAAWLGELDEEFAPPDFKLSSLMEYCGVERRGDAHEALSDVRGALDLARALRRRLYALGGYVEPGPAIGVTGGGR